jgi:hypothetical protein
MNDSLKQEGTSEGYAEDERSYREAREIESRETDLDAEDERSYREAREMYEKLLMEAEALEREIALEENR